MGAERGSGVYACVCVWGRVGVSSKLPWRLSPKPGTATLERKGTTTNVVILKTSYITIQEIYLNSSLIPQGTALTTFRF